MSQSLLIVEGRDETRLFEALLGDAIGSLVIRETGKHRLTPKFRAILEDLRRKGPVTRIGIVRDADDDPALAFTSVSSTIQHVGLNPPSRHGEYSQGDTRVGVFITPDGQSRGAIEALCRQTLAGKPESDCVDDYLDCMQGCDALLSNDRDKSFVHAYLASRSDPMVRVGEGAQSGVWQFDHDAFSPLRAFLHELL